MSSDEWSEDETLPIDQINFSILDQFEDAGKREKKIHLRYKKRNGKKVLTIVEGLTEGESDKYMKIWKKSFCCTGTKMTKEEDGIKESYLQFTGDCRGRIKKYLKDNKIADEDDIKIHIPNPID